MGGCLWAPYRKGESGCYDMDGEMRLVVIQGDTMSKRLNGRGVSMAISRADEHGDGAEEQAKKEIGRIVRAINAAWVYGKPGEMEAYLDERMVLVQPGFAERLVGREACIESYREFASHAAIHSYEEGEATVDLRGETAIASFRYAIEYEMDGEIYHDVGHDVFVLMHGDGGWRAVWRTLIPQEH